MAKSNASQSPGPSLPDIKFVPAVAHLTPTAPTERRNVAAREALLRRVHSEFEEMPGLSLTLPQATKLFGVAPDACSRILARLADERFLDVRSYGRYVLHAVKP